MVERCRPITKNTTPRCSAGPGDTLECPSERVDPRWHDTRVPLSVTRQWLPIGATVRRSPSPLEESDEVAFGTPVVDLRGEIFAYGGSIRSGPIPTTPTRSRFRRVCAVLNRAASTGTRPPDPRPSLRRRVRVCNRGRRSIDRHGRIRGRSSRRVSSRTRRSRLRSARAARIDSGVRRQAR
jgi:hypothetical protein